MLVNTYGLHMRPATRFVNLASTFASDVRVHFSGMRANGKSLLDMTCLAAPCGAWIDLEAVGDDAEEALAALVALVADGFHMGDEAA